MIEKLPTAESSIHAQKDMITSSPACNSSRVPRQLRCNLCGVSSAEHIITKNGSDLVSCTECGLIFVANPPTDNDRATLYSFDSGYHQSLLDDEQCIDQHQREAVANMAVLQAYASSGRLLDIGCSTGLFLEAARAAGWLAHGLEYSADSARVALETRGLDVKCGELRPDSYPAAAYDVVTMWDVIEHLPDPCGTVAILSKVVAPEGLLIVKTPNADGLYPKIGRRLAKALGFWGHPEPPGHLYQFSETTLSRMVREAGFEVVAVRHRRIPISYSFGTLAECLRSVKWALYCALLAPVAWVGPFVGRGDDLIVVAKRPRQ